MHECACAYAWMCVCVCMNVRVPVHECACACEWMCVCVFLTCRSRLSTRHRFALTYPIYPRNLIFTCYKFAEFNFRVLKCYKFVKFNIAVSECVGLVCVCVWQSGRQSDHGGNPSLGGIGRPGRHCGRWCWSAGPLALDGKDIFLLLQGCMGVVLYVIWFI